MRAFQVETDDKISELKEARLRESEQREAQRGELFLSTPGRRVNLPAHGTRP